MQRQKSNGKFIQPKKAPPKRSLKESFKDLSPAEASELRRKLISSMTLMDDPAARTVFSNRERLQSMLRVLLEDEKLILDSVSQEVEANNLMGRALRFDLIAASNDHVYNVEFQRISNQSLKQRAAFYNAMLYAKYVPKGTEAWTRIPKMTTIFIIEKDFTHKHRAGFQVERFSSFDQEPWNDGSIIYFFNTEVHEDTEIGRLLADLINPNPETMHSPNLRDALQELHGPLYGTEENQMTFYRDFVEQLHAEAHEEGLEEGLLAGREEGARMQLLKIAKTMKQKGEPEERIIEYTGLTAQQLQQLAEE